MRIFNDGSIPETQRSQILRAAQLIDDAARLIGGVRHAYSLSDPMADELAEILSPLDIAMMRCDRTLSAHPARK